MFADELQHFLSKAWAVVVDGEPVHAQTIADAHFFLQMAAAEIDQILDHQHVGRVKDVFNIFVGDAYLRTVR